MSDDLAAAVARVWPDGESAWEVLGGGITNHNVKVTRPDGRVRPPRRRAATPTCSGSTAGSSTRRRARRPRSASGPRVVAFVEPEGWLVTAFIEGSSRRWSGCASPPSSSASRARSARSTAAPAIPGRFDALEVVEAYRDTALERGATLPAAFADALRARAPDRAARGPARRAGPCHNDLLNANFIDDGERLRIVDWEYAGMGDPFFDLANFSINHELDADGRATLLARLRGERARPRPGRARPDAVHVRLPRGDVGRRAERRLASSTSTSRATRREHFERMERTAAEPGFRAALGA